MSLVALTLNKRKIIIKKLKEVGAISEVTAVSLNEIGISKASMLEFIQKLVNDKILIKTKDNKYYINN